jgi:hypothetical protein
MSVFIEVLAWILIAYATVAIVVTLLPGGAGRHARDQRHSRGTSLREVWPDLRTFLPALAIGLSLLGHQRPPGTPGWWLPQVPLFAAMTVYLGAWIWSRTRGAPRTPEAERQTRNYLLAFAATTPLVAIGWKADPATWWVIHIPLVAAGVVFLEAGLMYLRRRKSGGPTAEPS